MRTTARLAAIAATVIAGTLIAAPAQAEPLPAVTGCAFTALYSDYVDGQFTGVKYYYPYNTELTVTDGGSGGWYVTVNRNGEQGWMDDDCVLFLA